MKMTLWFWSVDRKRWYSNSMHFWLFEFCFGDAVDNDMKFCHDVSM